MHSFSVIFENVTILDILPKS